MAVKNKLDRNINIGLFGLGNIGTGVVKILEKNLKTISGKAAFNLRVKKICVKDIKKKRGIDVKKYFLTDNADDILDDPEIDVVVELIGGVDAASEIIRKAIQKGKNVVTANKALMAEQGKELFALAEKHKVKINFEGAVAGCIPIIKSLLISLVANNLYQIRGIINGTCNYILTKMSNEGMEYEDALSLAQKKGFAEPDPHFDVSGKDAAQKLVLLSRLAFNTGLDYKDAYVEGIERISKTDIGWAKENGFSIKHLGIAKIENSKLICRVEPVLLRNSDSLASIEDETNAVEVRGDLVGQQLYSGKGAGQMPTASVVIGDIVDICIRNEMFYLQNSLDMADEDEIESKFYLRFLVNEKPGVISSISGVLAEGGISISSIIQKSGDEKIVGVQIITHKTPHGKIKEAIKKSDLLPALKYGASGEVV